VLKTCQACGRTFNARLSRMVACSVACRHETRRQDPVARFWKHVNKTDGCWLWTGGCTGGGYGTFSVRGAVTYTHRFSYELHFGPIPTGFFVCHHCDNPRCVRPDHFFLGKHAENAADMKAKGRCNLQRPTMRGPGNPAAKFTLDQAQAIRKRIEGGELQAAVAREFGVHYSTIRRICKWERYNAVA
jgi:hypothetical protein